MEMLDELIEDLQGKSRFGKPTRSADSFEENPIGLDHEAARELGAQLNRHQASLFVLFHQYQKHHWLVEGPQWHDLHLYLESSYTQIHEDLDSLAERLTALGGIPSAGLKALLKASYIEHEPEGFYPIRQSLEHSLRAEGSIARALRHSIVQANEAQDFGTGHLLRKVLERVEDRAHHLEHYLAADGLKQS